MEVVKKKYPNAISKLVVDFLFDVLGGVYDDKFREHWDALGGLADMNLLAVKDGFEPFRIRVV